MDCFLFLIGVRSKCEDKVTVYCDEGSAIQEYCQRNGIHKERIEEAKE